jgi:hypothetical protein
LPIGDHIIIDLVAEDGVSNDDAPSPTSERGAVGIGERDRPHAAN